MRPPFPPLDSDLLLPSQVSTSRVSNITNHSSPLLQTISSSTSSSPAPLTRSSEGTSVRTSQPRSACRPFLPAESPGPRSLSLGCGQLRAREVALDRLSVRSLSQLFCFFHSDHLIRSPNIQYRFSNQPTSQSGLVRIASKWRSLGSQKKRGD